MRELTITEVMRNPIVTYEVHGRFPDESAMPAPYETLEDAVDAARMMEQGGALNVRIERWTTRVVQEHEDVEWR